MGVLGGLFKSSNVRIAGPIDPGEGRDKESTYECDYDRNAIPLYQAMENGAWIPTLEFFETGNWSSSVFSSIFGVSDPLPPARQARTWVTRFDTDGETVRWSQLPIHAALTFHAPFKIIEHLLMLYPASVRCTNDEHMLPLHIALKHGATDNVVRMLCNYFPEAVRQRDRKGRIPTDLLGNTTDRDVILKTIVSQLKRDSEKKKTAEVKEVRSQYQRKQAQAREYQDRCDEMQQEMRRMRQECMDLKRELQHTKASLWEARDAQPERRDPPPTPTASNRSDAAGNHTKFAHGAERVQPKKKTHQSEDQTVTTKSSKGSSHSDVSNHSSKSNSKSSSRSSSRSKAKASPKAKGIVSNSRSSTKGTALAGKPPRPRGLSRGLFKRSPE